MSEPTFRPPHDFVYVERMKGAEKTASGLLYLPDSVRVKDKAHEGRVLAIGPGRIGGNGQRRAMPDIKVGDHVIMDPYAEGESGSADKPFAIVRATEIIAVIEPGSTTGDL